jgi:hypothetical protein
VLKEDKELRGWNEETRGPNLMAPKDFMSPLIKGSPQVRMLTMLSRVLVTEFADYHTIFQLLKDHREAVIELSAKKELMKFKFITDTFAELKAGSEAERTLFKSEFMAEMARVWETDKAGFLLLHEPVPETVKQIRELVNSEQRFMVYYLTSDSPQLVDELLGSWKTSTGNALLREEVGHPLERNEEKKVVPKPAETGIAPSLETVLKEAVNWGEQVGAGAPAAVEAEPSETVDQKTLISLDRVLFLKGKKSVEKLERLMSLANDEGVVPASVYVMDDVFRQGDVALLAQSGFSQLYVTDGSESPFERMRAGSDGKVTLVNSWELAKTLRTIIGTTRAVDLF